MKTGGAAVKDRGVLLRLSVVASGTSCPAVASTVPREGHLAPTVAAASMLRQLRKDAVLIVECEKESLQN